MNRKTASREIMNLLIRIVTKYHRLERVPHHYHEKEGLYHSERHMLDHIGNRPDLTMSEFAAAVGVTRGAISQVVGRLEEKGVVQRYRKADSDKAVYVRLTPLGRKVYDAHQAVNERTLAPLHRELGRHGDDKVEFLREMLRWIDRHLDESREVMKGKH